MEIRTLIIRAGRGKIISKPWDFEAMCLIDDNLDKAGVVNICMDSLCYLFEGTTATPETFSKMSYERLQEMCEKLFSWFVSDIKSIPAGQQANPNHNAKLRDIYKAVFKAWGTLPREIGLQRPKNLFKLLEEEEPDLADLPMEVRALYGL